MNGADRAVQQPGAVQFSQNSHDAAGAVNVFHMHIGLGGRDLGQHRHLARQPVNIGHGKVNLALMRGGQQVQHGVGRSAHRDIQPHGVFKGAESGDAARQNRIILALIMAFCQIHDLAASLEEQALAVGVGGKGRAITRQRQTQSLCQAVHRVGGEHPRARAAVGNADHRVGAMRVDHVFHAIGNDFARGQRIQHPVVAHGDTIINGDGVELLGDTARRLDFARDHLAEVFQMDVARHELRERVDDGNDRLAEIIVGHAGCAPKSACAGHVASVSRGSGAVMRHGLLLFAIRNNNCAGWASPERR